MESTGPMKPKNKILVVDDHPANLEIVEEILGEFEVFTATCGEEGLEMAISVRPDIILLDIMMPGIKGYEVCRELRSIPALLNSKIILLSAKAMLSERLKGYEAGADDYVVKPFEEEELVAKVRVYCSLKNAEEENKLKTELLNLMCLNTVNPLSGIISPLKNLKEDPGKDAEEQFTEIERVYQSVCSLQGLISRVVLLSSINAGEIIFKFKPTDLCKIVCSESSALEIKASEKNIVILKELPEKAIANVDPLQIKRVIAVFLDNAIRYSPNNVHVIVEISESNGDFILSVTDFGKGIDAEFCPQIYEPFTYVATSGKNPEWHGLGMAVANKIAQGHNGRIEIDSVQGTRTVCSIVLPNHLPEYQENVDLDESQVLEYKHPIH